MKGAIVGDVLGSRFEFLMIKTKKVDLFSEYGTFTDDTVLTVAIAHSILDNKPYKDYILKYARKYPNRLYGSGFYKWFSGSTQEPYGSYNNGSAMRVSPIGWAFNTEEKVLEEAKKSAECTHNHREGIEGAQAVALSIFLARTGKTKKEIKKRIETQFHYNLSRKLKKIRPTYSFQTACIKSVPEAIICFLESKSYEDAIRNAISLGGDSDTQAAIAGSIAEAFYKKIPEDLYNFVSNKLDKSFIKVIDKFYKKY